MRWQKAGDAKKTSIKQARRSAVLPTINSALVIDIACFNRGILRDHARHMWLPTIAGRGAVSSVYQRYD